MEANELLLSRRSVRKYKDEIVNEKTINEIMEVAKFYPSWGNTQVARFHFVTNEDMIAKISETAVKGFVYNQKTLKYAKNLLVLSYVQGKSGHMKDIETSNEDAMKWEIFDAGIACQQFALAAHAKGVGSTVFGIIDEDEVANIINLPEGETVAVVMTYGYTNESPATPPRKEIADITSFIK